MEPMAGIVPPRLELLSSITGIYWDSIVFVHHVKNYFSMVC